MTRTTANGLSRARYGTLHPAWGRGAGECEACVGTADEWHTGGGTVRAGNAASHTGHQCRAALFVAPAAHTGGAGSALNCSVACRANGAAICKAWLCAASGARIIDAPLDTAPQITPPHPKLYSPLALCVASACARAELPMPTTARPARRPAATTPIVEWAAPHTWRPCCVGGGATYMCETHARAPHAQCCSMRPHTSLVSDPTPPPRGHHTYSRAERHCGQTNGQLAHSLVAMRSRPHRDWRAAR